MFSLLPLKLIFFGSSAIPDGNDVILACVYVYVRPIDLQYCGKTVLQKYSSSEKGQCLIPSHSCTRGRQNVAWWYRYIKRPCSKLEAVKEFCTISDTKPGRKSDLIYRKV